LTEHAEALLPTAAPVVLASDDNVMPTELDVYKTECWHDDALFRPEVQDAFARLVAWGWSDAVAARANMNMTCAPFGGLQRPLRNWGIVD
jgi:exodeoxyribonuclease III